MQHKAKHHLDRSVCKNGASVTGRENTGSLLAFLFAAALLILPLSGCKKKKPAPTAMPPSISYITVQPQRAVTTTELSGRTSSFLIAEIRPQVNGLIQKRLFKEGSEVKAGDVLYQIDPEPFKAVLDNAKAALARAEAGLIPLKLREERYKKLLADNAISRQDYDDAMAARKQAEAEIKVHQASVRQAQINLNYTKVTAPISGRIGKSSVTDGALVAAYQQPALATIQQLDQIYVDVPQSTSELLRLQRKLKDGRLNPDGDNQNKVKLIMEDGFEYPQMGTLQFQDVTVDPTTGSVILRVVFPNPDRLLLPGMFVKTILTEGVNEKAILVPQQAVSRTAKGEPMTLIVDSNNNIQVRMLTIEQALGDKWLISSGLSAGDRIVVEGAQRVRPGMQVQAMPLGSEKKADPATAKTAEPNGTTN